MEFQAGLGMGLLMAAILYAIIGVGAALRFAAWARQTEARIAALEQHPARPRCSVTVWTDKQTAQLAANGDAPR